MEEVLVIVFQVFFELIFNVLGSGLLDMASRSTSSSSRTEEGCGVFFLHAAVGGGLGFVSTLLVPHLILPFAWMRIANLIVGPFIAGGGSALMASLIRPKGSDAWGPFVHGFLFALMFGIARFAFAAR